MEICTWESSNWYLGVKEVGVPKYAPAETRAVQQPVDGKTTRGHMWRRCRLARSIIPNRIIAVPYYSVIACCDMYRN